VPQTVKDRLLVELGKEHLKLTAKADKLRKADPAVSFHFHHAVGNAISSLSASKKPISSAEDLKNIKGFGPHVLSLARTCLHRIWAADPLLSPRPRRPRVKSMTRTYTPRVGSQAFAVMCIARRHDGITMQDFARFNDDYGYSSTPFVQGPKGWAAQPMAQLCEKGLMVGSFESGWTLTDSGEEIADRALHKWDTSAEQEQTEEEDDDDDGDDNDSACGKEEKKGDKKDTKTSSTGKSKKTRKRADSDDFFGEIEILDHIDGFTSPLTKKPREQKEQKGATSSGSSSLSASVPVAAASAAAVASAASASSSSSAPVRGADEEKVK
jgi:hypothetical protein